MPRANGPQCSECGKRCRAKSGTCPTCTLKRDGSKAKRPEVPCVGCGKKTLAKAGKCRRCTRGEATLRVTMKGALDPKKGDWVTGSDLIARWVPKPTKKKAV